MSEDRFALKLQQISSVGDRVAVAASLAANRAKDGRFSPAEIIAVFHSMNIPPPANVSAALIALEQKKLVLKFSGGRRALTPLGQALVTKIGFAEGNSQTVTENAGSAEFAHVDHTVIPAWAAPPRWKAGIQRLLERHEFDGNVFAMTRFPSEGDIPDPVAAAIEVARFELGKYGLHLHLASDAAVEDDLMGNVGAYMWACRYGLGFIEDRIGKGLNYNTVIEIGGMAVTGRRCAILKDATSPDLPTDLLGQIYKPVDFDVEKSVSQAVGAWAKSDLSLKII